MTNTDNAFVQGMLKQAAEIDRTLQKQAYGKRLTALLQRKGKLPMDSKPTVGVSSFPKQADEIMDALAPYLERAGQGVDSMKQHAGAGMDKLKELWSTGVEGVNEAGRATGRGALNVNNFLKDNPVTAPAIGAGVGGLAGALSGKSENKETGEKGTRGRNALIGMLLGGGAGAGAHALASGPGEQALMQLRTQGVTPRPEYTPEASQGNPLQMLKQLGLAPLNVGQNAPPSSLSVKPRF